MRTLPIDSNSLRMVATGEVQAVAVWAELPDGSRRPVPDAQERDQHGTPLWSVGAIVPPAQEDDRAEMIAVRIAAHDRPQVEQFGPLRFDALVCRVGVNRRTGQLAQYWSAARVAGASAPKGS